MRQSWSTTIELQAYTVWDKYPHPFPPGDVFMGHLFGGHRTIACCHLTLILGSSQSTCMEVDFNVAISCFLVCQTSPKWCYADQIASDIEGSQYNDRGKWELVTTDPVEFERLPDEVQGCMTIFNRLRGIFYRRSRVLGRRTGGCQHGTGWTCKHYVLNRLCPKSPQTLIQYLRELDPKLRTNIAIFCQNWFSLYYQYLTNTTNLGFKPTGHTDHYIAYPLNTILQNDVQALLIAHHPQ